MLYHPAGSKTRLRAWQLPTSPRASLRALGVLGLFLFIDINPQSRTLPNRIIFAVVIAAAGVALGGDAPPAGAGKSGRHNAVRIRLGGEGDQFISRQFLGRFRIEAFNEDR